MKTKIINLVSYFFKRTSCNLGVRAPTSPKLRNKGNVSPLDTFKMLWLVSWC